MRPEPVVGKVQTMKSTYRLVSQRLGALTTIRMSLEEQITKTIRVVELRPPGSSSLPAHLESDGRIRRVGSISGFLVILVLDLLALDDITTAGAWMPEFVWLLASIPALVTLGHFALKSPISPFPR